MMSNPGISGYPVRDPRLLEQARALFLPAFSRVFAAALSRLDERLFDLIEVAGSAQTPYWDGISELRQNRAEIVTRLQARLDVVWRALIEGRPLSAEGPLVGQEGGGAQSPPSEHALEVQRAVANSARVLRRDCEAVLGRLDRRLAWIAGGLVLGPDTNPVGPQHLIVALLEALPIRECVPEIRRALVKLCELDLAEPLARLYADLDDMLARAGVNPDMSRPSQIVRDDLPTAEAAARADSESIAPVRAERFVSRRRRGCGGVSLDLDAVYADVDAQSALLDTMHELLQRRRGLRDNANLTNVVGAVTAAQQRPLSQREMLSVLSLLQATPSATRGMTVGEQSDSLAQRLKSEVLSGATRLGVDPANARLDPMDEDAIDLIGMLFEVMLNERDLEGRSRELVVRLIVPFVKVAMLDRGMFVQKTHPARLLLNSLTEVCEGNTGDSPAERVLMTKVEEIIERLVAEFNDNIAIFATLDDEFGEFLVQHRRRVEITERRAAETQRGQERLDMARARAQHELNMRLDSTLPEAIAEFLRNPWQHNLTMVILRDGENSAVMAEALKVADAVLNELDEARRHLIATPWLQAWQEPLQKVFGSVGLQGDAAMVAISALHDTLQAIAETRPELQRPLPELPSVLLPQPVPETVTVDLDVETNNGGFDPADVAHFRSLQIGTWLDFVDKEGKVQAGKLSWVSPMSARLLFVNRRGVRFCVASSEELAVMVRLGRLRAHVSNGAFDSAMQGVFDRLDAQCDVVH